MQRKVTLRWSPKAGAGAAITAGVRTIMVGHQKLLGFDATRPACLSPLIVSVLLRELRFLLNGRADELDQESQECKLLRARVGHIDAVLAHVAEITISPDADDETP